MTRSSALDDMEISAIWGSVVRGGHRFISNDPASHSDGAGCPGVTGRSLLSWACRWRQGWQTVDMIALANKPGKGMRPPTRKLSRAWLSLSWRRCSESELRLRCDTS